MIAYRRFLLLLLFLVTQYIPVFAQQNPSSGAMQLDAVARTFEAISQSNAYTESLTSASQNVLPVGIKRTVGNMEVVIAVDKVVFHPEYTELSVFAKITLLQASKKKEKVLFFGARGIKLSYEGSIIGDANLALLADIEIPFNNGNMSIVLLGDYNTATGNSRSKTYMSIDCKGFKELGLDAEVRFPATLVEKVQPDGSVNMSDRIVSGHFSTVVSDWNDIVADITLPSFRIVGLDGFSFNLQNVVLDFSDARRPTSI